MVNPETDDGSFDFENCLLKHYVRKEGWLPVCKRRAASIKTSGKKRPRLKYFTFCAAGALDVVMLDMEKIVRRSKSIGFDSVYFFDVSRTYVLKTNETIPGAIGFPSDFLKVVLMDDPDENASVEAGASLEAPTTEPDTANVREHQQDLAMRQVFIRAFPFDIINLDLERYLFIPKEELPGRLINAVRKVLEWQRRKGETPDGKSYQIDSFSLMFTIRVGPSELSSGYATMVRDYLSSNLDSLPGLGSLFSHRSGGKNVDEFLSTDFEGFFKIAAPKAIISLIQEEDWHIDPDSGIRAFEFQRTNKQLSYRMLHVVMDVCRNSPTRERRPPGTTPQAAKAAYKQAVESLIQTPPKTIVEGSDDISGANVAEHLARVMKHRKVISGAVS